MFMCSPLILVAHIPDANFPLFHISISSLFYFGTTYGNETNQLYPLHHRQSHPHDWVRFVAILDFLKPTLSSIPKLVKCKVTTITRPTMIVHLSLKQFSLLI